MLASINIQYGSRSGDIRLNQSATCLRHVRFDGFSKVNGGSNVFFLKTGRQLYNIGDPIRNVTDIANARQNARRKVQGQARY
jgi:hypothetical protein